MSLEDGRISELRATAHPLRLQMLSLLTGAELSAAEVARELGVTQANASYHLRLLHAAGLLDIAGEESVRGGRAKRYRHRWDAQPPQSARPARSQFTDAELWVEPEVWERVFDLVSEASRLFHASARPPRTEGTVRANLSVAAFRMAGAKGGVR